MDSMNIPASTRLQRMSTFFRVLQIVFYLLGVLIAAFSVAVIIALLLDAQSSSAYSFESYLKSIASSLTTGMVISLSFFNGGFLFRDISRGESPFTAKQVKRLDVVAFLILGYAVFDGFLAICLAQIPFVQSSTVGVDSGNSPVNVNIGLFAFSALLFAFSSIFKYGILLQEESDDTV